MPVDGQPTAAILIAEIVRRQRNALRGYQNYYGHETRDLTPAPESVS